MLQNWGNYAKKKNKYKTIVTRHDQELRDIEFLERAAK